MCCLELSSVISVTCGMLMMMLLCCAGLAVGLDPEGYGNPDFCWLSIYDTLIWSFAGPIALVVSVSVPQTHTTQTTAHTT